jgi:hypothetical protein
MLQDQVSRPLIVNGGLLLLGLNAIVVNAEKLALRSSIPEGGELGGFAGRGIGDGVCSGLK